MCGQRFWIGAMSLLFLGVSGPAGAADGEASEPGRAAHDARVLAREIDRFVAAKWAESGVEPAAPADDAEYLRRVSIDLIGKIPTAAEAEDFLDDPGPEKRGRLVNRLLASPAYVTNATELWRALLLPEAETDDRARFLAPTFEAWLRKKVAENVGYDQLVREVLTMPLGSARRGVSVVTPRPEPTPVAFYAAKEGKPEEIAAGAARVFLGIRLECAQCHNHPFARWKREEFWGLAAFFAGVTKQGPADGFGAIREDAGRRELPIPGTQRVVRATFLDGSEPVVRSRSGPRGALADWILTPENPYFARAAVNRVWARFFGIGLVDPVDDMGPENPPSHPELLDELARQFAAHGYDLPFLLRAITASRAYGLTSRIRGADELDPQLFAAMPVRGLSPGQLVAVLAEATGSREAVRGQTARLLELFANRDESPTEAQTSILQALTLMNGRLVADSTRPETGRALGAIAEAPFLNTSGRIEALYLATLTRRPSPDELALLVRFVDGGGPTGDRAGALADVFWAILNGPEFRLNH